MKARVKSLLFSWLPAFLIVMTLLQGRGRSFKTSRCRFAR